MTAEAAPAVHDAERTSRLSDGEAAVQAAIRSVADARYRAPFWSDWTAWREKAPVVPPPGMMPWESPPAPDDVHAETYTASLQHAISAMVRRLMADGLPLAEARSLLVIVASEMDSRESSPSPDLSRMPRCRVCGAPCPTMRSLYCSGKHRKAWSRSRQAAASLPPVTSGASAGQQ